MASEEEIKEETTRKKEGEIIEDLGRITVAEEVIASIAATAASEVEGLGEMKSSVAEDIVGIFGSKRKGVETVLSKDGVSIALKVAVKYGHQIHKVAKSIQKRVKEKVEKTTGLSVTKVDVFVEKLQIHEEEEELKESELYEVALEYIQESTQGISLVDLGETIGVDWRRLIPLVNQMIDEGLVKKEDKKYFPTEPL